MLLLLVVILVSIWLIIKWFYTTSDLLKECEIQGIPNIAGKHLLRDWDALINLRTTKVLGFTLERYVRVFITDPLLLKELLNADSYCKPSFVRVLEILGDGIFSSCGKDWSRQRQLLNPQFVNREIKTKIQTILQCAISAARDLSNNDAKEVDVHQLFLLLTLEILNKTTFEAPQIDNNSSRILKSLKRYHQYKREAASANYFPVYRFLQEKVFQDELYLTSLMKSVIEDRCIAENKQQSFLLDFLVQASKTNLISEKELLDNSVTFLLAGHETTASLLVWTFYLLALHPKWQEQARTEALEMFAHDGEVNMVSLGRLKTITNILMETLRLYPPQPLIGRTCVKEHMLGKYRIPVGLEVVVPVASLHRNEEVWGHNAGDFCPGRFSNGIKGACSQPLAYLPFGTGPRTCIGQSLALTEAKVVLVVFLRNFMWELGSCYQHCPTVTLTVQPKYGMPIIVKSLE